MLSIEMIDIEGQKVLKNQIKIIDKNFINVIENLVPNNDLHALHFIDKEYELDYSDIK